MKEFDLYGTSLPGAPVGAADKSDPVRQSSDESSQLETVGTQDNQTVCCRPFLEGIIGLWTVH